MFRIGVQVGVRVRVRVRIRETWGRVPDYDVYNRKTKLSIDVGKSAIIPITYKVK